MVCWLASWDKIFISLSTLLPGLRLLFHSFYCTSSLFRFYLPLTKPGLSYCIPVVTLTWDVQWLSLAVFLRNPTQVSAPLHLKRKTSSFRNVVFTSFENTARLEKFQKPKSHYKVQWQRWDFMQWGGRKLCKARCFLLYPEVRDMYHTQKLPALLEFSLEKVASRANTTYTYERERGKKLLGPCPLTNKPTERPPHVNEVSDSFYGWRVSRSERDGSLRSYSRFSRPDMLLFLSSSSSVVLTRLSGLRSRPTTSKKIW
jgi:hypothetical protein